jgi:O-antigen biosynthesis protein
MRVCFLVPELRPSGGIAVVLEHARRLGDHAIEAEVMVAGDPRARESEWDVAIATFWTTWPELHELRSRRRAVFLQSVEARFYRDTEPFDRLGADAALAQDAGYFVVAGWMRDLLAAVRPGVPVWHIPNGIDKARFSGGDGPRREGPLRVLVEGQPSLWFKGVPEAAAAVRAMERPAELTVVALDPAHARELGADRVVGGLDADGMAALYRETDVLLKLSRVEGMFGPPLEGFHKGATCVVTPVTGHDEYVVHGENGLVVDWDDTAGTARALDLLARDGVLLHRLRSGALATARSWPGWEQQGQVMAAVLRAVRREPLPDARHAGRRLAHDMATALSDGERLATDLRVARQVAAQVQGSRAYRAAVIGRSTIERVIRAPGRWRRRRRGEE